MTFHSNMSNIDDILSMNPPLDYSGTSRIADVSAGNTLSVKDVRDAVASIKKLHKKSQDDIRMRMKMPGYWEEYTLCTKIIMELHKKRSWKRKKLGIALRVLCALDIEYPIPVSMATIKAYRKLREEYKYLAVGGIAII